MLKVRRTLMSGYEAVSEQRLMHGTKVSRDQEPDHLTKHNQGQKGVLGVAICKSGI